MGGMLKRCAIGLATFVVAVMLSACGGPPAWLDVQSPLTVRDIEVAKSLATDSLTWDATDVAEVQGLQEQGGSPSDLGSFGHAIRGAEAAEDYLAARYGEQFRAIAFSTPYESAIAPAWGVTTCVVESGPFEGETCKASYRLKGAMTWRDDYGSIYLGDE